MPDNQKVPQQYIPPKTFAERCRPLMDRGIAVIPVAAGGKNATLKDWGNADFTWRMAKEWDQSANVGCVTRGFCFVDDDRGNLAEIVEQATGISLQRITYTVKTSKGFHYYFKSTVESMMVGKLVNHSAADFAFDFQCQNGDGSKFYVVGPGSVHPSGAVYTPLDERASIADMPPKLLEWLRENAEKKGPATAPASDPDRPVSEDFDFDVWLEWYKDAVSVRIEEAPRYHLDECPFAGRHHTDGHGKRDERATTIFFDGSTLGFKCLAATCEGSNAGIGGLIRKLNENHPNYPGAIWEGWGEDDTEELAREFGAEVLQPDAPAAVSGEAAAPSAARDGKPKTFDLWTDGKQGVRGIRLSDVRERPVDWLWKNRLPAGCGMIVSGAVGTNKSMVSVALTACVTTGSDWPDGEKNTRGPREVLIAATEDDLETTIKPRLMAAGADATKVVALHNVFDVDESGVPASRELNIDEDGNKLYRTLLANPQILMVVLDPLTGFFGQVDGNDNKKIRPMMQKIAKICRLTKTAFVMLIHENKRSDANAVDRILGAGAVSQVVRAGVRISKDPKSKPDGRLMANIKSSLSRDNGGMKFSVASKDVVACDGTVLEEIGYLEWGEKHGMSADDVLAEEAEAKKEAQDGGAKLERAVGIFQDALVNGKRLHKDVHPLLDAAGISEATKRRARQTLGIRSSKSYPWYWWLPGLERDGEPEQKIAPVWGDEAL